MAVEGWQGAAVDAASGAPRPSATPQDSNAAAWHRVRIGDTEPLWLTALLRFDMIAVLVSLYLCLVAYDEPPTLGYGVLAVLALVLTGRLVTPPELNKTLTFGSMPRLSATRLIVEWATIIGVLLFVGFAAKISDEFSRRVLISWFAVTPFALLGAHFAQSQVARWLNRHGRLAPRYVIVGMNSVGLELSRRLQPVSFLGFFDFRSGERVETHGSGHRLAGKASEVADFVRRHGVRCVYIALPITNAPRILRLLASLKDTTATVYFVPDIFAFDLIQARIVDLNGIPALAVCDTPLRGTDALSKRLMDVTLSAIGLIVLSPLLVALAAAVKLTSPGPALFRQRRYGLDGEPIVVFKLRTMRVCEDGDSVRQASRGDARITKLGKLLRRTSLDELPQLLNVLGGSMSLVGPRPHAVAHNEQYRRLISGYMLRHKVRPGITGWAQVHGLRGETDTIDKMERRVHYDLDYLKNWSLVLDLRILVLTARIVLNDRSAY